MSGSNGRASKRLVVGRGTDAAPGSRMPHSRFWRGVSRRVRLLAGLGLAAVLLATFAALQAPPLQAQATTEVEVPVSWNLKPTGLGGGDKFRLLFLSSTKSSGTSADIAVYNTFIQNRAAAGHTDIRAYSAGFRVVGCTADVDARDNTGTTGTGVPIYWLKGNKVADDNADFYDESWDDEANDKNESGNNSHNTSQFSNFPFTGCDHNGTEFLDSTGSWGLGESSVRVGRPNNSVTNNGPLSGTVGHASASSRPMYGLSQVFEVTVTDATLSDLELENARNGSAITLSPGFAFDHLDYSASVGFPVSEITVIPTTNDAGASIRYLNASNNELSDVIGGRSGFQANLVAGVQNVIKVEVTAEDGTATETYTLTVARAGEPGQVLVSEQLLSLTEGDGAYYNVRLNRQPAADVTVTIGGHAGTNVTPNPASLTFTTSNWSQAKWVFVSTTADTNTTNESVTLTHTATSSDSLFDDITIPSVIVNVDDHKADAPDRHIRTIRPPPGSHALDPGDKVLPEEEISVLVVERGVEKDMLVVAEGHIWRPSGLWGDPDADTVWVVDPSHFGIHPLKLSALKQGRIERHVAADNVEFDYRLNYRCHFNGSRASGYGNPSLTVMSGRSTQLWIANESSGTLDAYDRNESSTTASHTRNRHFMGS